MMVMVMMMMVMEASVVGIREDMIRSGGGRMKNRHGCRFEKSFNDEKKMMKTKKTATERNQTTDSQCYRRYYI